jgi:hypothetical protein
MSEIIDLGGCDGEETIVNRGELHAKIQKYMDFIDLFDDAHIGIIALQNNMSIERAIAAGAKMKEQGTENE